MDEKITADVSLHTSLTIRQREEELKSAKLVFDSERRRREDDQKRHKTETEGLQVVISWLI